MRVVILFKELVWLKIVVISNYYLLMVLKYAGDSLSQMSIFC